MMLAGVEEHARTGAGMHLPYSRQGAIRSISKRVALRNNDVVNTALDNLLSAGGEAMFCSGHVVLCFQSACSQMQIQNVFPAQGAQNLFNLTDSCYQPAFLYKVLKESTLFRHIGTVKGAVKVN